MSSQEDKDESEIDSLYPEGSVERDVLNYSRSTHPRDDVPPMLVTAYKVLMGITLVMAGASAFALLTH